MFNAALDVLGRERRAFPELHHKGPVWRERGSWRVVRLMADSTGGVLALPCPRGYATSTSTIRWSRTEVLRNVLKFFLVCATGASRERTMPSQQLLRFGPYRLAGASGQLWRHKQVVKLPPKAVAVLWCLATQAGQVVTNETLLETVWAETEVSDAVLTVCIPRPAPGLGRRRPAAALHRDRAPARLSLYRARHHGPQGFVGKPWASGRRQHRHRWTLPRSALRPRPRAWFPSSAGRRR